MICLCILVDTTDHESVCSMSMHLYGRMIWAFFIISSISKFLEFTTFSGPTFFSGSVIKLIKQKTKIGRMF